MPEFVRSDPSMWEAIYADPSVPLDRALVRQIIDDQRRLSRRWLYPIARVVSRILVALISIVKRVLPFRWMPLHTMDTLCVWFLRRFVSPDAVELLIRHFVVETNLVNFIIRNTPVAMEPVTLRPETIAGLGDQAVVEHDVNVYDVLIALDDVTLTRRGDARLHAARHPAPRRRARASQTPQSRHPDRPLLHEHPVLAGAHGRGVPPRGAFHPLRRLLPRDPRGRLRRRDVPPLEARRA